MRTVKIKLTVEQLRTLATFQAVGIDLTPMFRAGLALVESMPGAEITLTFSTPKKTRKPK